MNQRYKKNILVAVDGSMYSDYALHYVAKLFATDRELIITLITWLSASASIMPSLADPKNTLIPGEKKQGKEETAQCFLHKAKERLVANGTKEEQIQLRIEGSGQDIAAYIHQYAINNMPDALLLGRRGLKGITEMLMGSISATLFRKCHTIPLWINDGKVEHSDFFVPVDGSVNSLLAVDHLAHILHGRDDIRIYLFHCTALFGKKINCSPQLFFTHWDEKWCNTYLCGQDCLFVGPKQLLLEANIPEANIVILPEKSDLEESHGIISQAKKHKCGTIVMGRRSAGMAKGLLGGVSDRTIKRVENLALWIVG